MSSGTPESSAAVPERFDELLLRLRSLVERLEGGHISLEDGLRCFEEGMTLCRRGGEILDSAERRVEVLLGNGKDGIQDADGAVRTCPQHTRRRRMSKTFDLDTWATARRAEIENTLKARLPPPEEDPGRLLEAMRYSVLAPGKRIRPLLAMAAAEAVGSTSSEPIRLAAAAIELVHTYSLVHDDLPAMDDDDTRRGQPSNHKVFGEATAILAGDALLTLAFEWLSEAGVLARTAQEEGRWARSSRAVGFLHASRALARAAGMAGMVRGQARDLAGKNSKKGPGSLQELETLHREKTGALFRAALEVGALAAGAPATELAALRDFGDYYGVAFQHADDLADNEHKDLASQAKPRVRELADRATAALDGMGPGAEPLRAMARALGHK